MPDQSKEIEFAAYLPARGIVPRGVIHAGAHEGEELDEYLAMKVRRVLFIEPNPDVFARLSQRVRGIPGVAAVQCAVADHDGTATLRVTSASQSSSLLPLKLHRQLYPQIAETHQIAVPCRRIDTLVSELRLNPADFNLLHLDIQGAELLALRGASTQMVYLDAIRTEINLAELYEGCPLVGDIDAFLETRGYRRAGTKTAWHPTWGDAIYVGRPVVTMSSLGRNGQFGNQLFQYMFLKVLARVHALELELPRWVGVDLFGCDELPVSCKLPTVQEDEGGAAAAALLEPSASPPKRVDWVGHFQFHTSHYAPHRQYVRSLFQPVPAIAAVADAALTTLRSRGKTIVAIHLRRGEYGRQPVDHPWCYAPPNQWYIEWLQTLWPTLDQPVLYIASDERDRVVADFARFSPVTSRDLRIDLPTAPYYIDYHVLRHADVVAISNSTFSFHACMMNESARQFVRPHRVKRAMVEFDPWNDEPLWKLPEH